MSSAACAPSS